MLEQVGRLKSTPIGIRAGLAGAEVDVELLQAHFEIEVGLCPVSRAASLQRRLLLASCILRLLGLLQPQGSVIDPKHAQRLAVLSVTTGTIDGVGKERGGALAPIDETSQGLDVDSLIRIGLGSVEALVTS